MIDCIIAVYNRPEMLQRAINSVLGQSYRQWKLIIVDDCSTDHTLAVAQNAARHDARITVVKKTTHNGSVTYAKKLGVSKGTSEYICFLDSDDILNPTAFNDVIAVFNDYDLVYTDQQWFVDGKPNMISPAGSIPYSKENMLVNNCIQHLAVYKRTLYTAVNGLSLTFRYCANYDLYLKMSEVGRIFHLKKILYQYNWNDNYSSIMNDYPDLHLKYANLARKNACIRRGIPIPPQVMANLP
jgi:glycosyltransferase involved in cell wall biosynthesis